jgi:hypothetical protein
MKDSISLGLACLQAGLKCTAGTQKSCLGKVTSINLAVNLVTMWKLYEN